MGWTVRPARRVGPALMMADSAALIAFVLVGVVEHDGGVTAGSVARTAVPLLAAWFALARVMGTYRLPALRTLLATWIGAVPVAVAVRSLVAGGPWGVRLLVFLGVALSFTLLFLFAARTAVRVIAGTGAEDA